MRKKFTCSLIGQAGVLLALGVLSGADASAKHLSPEDALSMVQSGARKIVSASPLKLAYVQESESEGPAVYVFNRENAPGFYVLAADDAVGDIMLGYSDTGVFSADNMAPAFQWLLEAYSMHVGACADGVAPSRPNHAPAEWGAIEPLVFSQWTQTAPYNDMCPVVLGERSISGCVSVAMAQVMRKHRWPESGKGSYSYEYILNNNRYNVESVFSDHHYDWGNMLDAYTGESTQEQRDAVARLVFDCGVAANTLYIPDGYTRGSSASLAKGAIGMIEHFGYDRSMQYCCRGWYTDTEWDILLYSQLAQGLPVLYSGKDSSGGGHAFVLDGYDGMGMFHFNFGWAGYQDGYYTLDGITYYASQEAMIDVCPATDSSSVVYRFAVLNDFVTDRNVYNVSADYIKFGGGFYCFTLSSSVQAEVGIKNTADGSVAVYGKASFEVETGFNNMTLSSQKFPKGEYDVYPVYRVQGGDWTEMQCNIAQTSGRLHFKNDGATITVGTVEVGGVTDAAYDAVKVTAGGGYIHIEAPVDTEVAVYDVAGSLRYSGTDRIIPVENHRIYIVRVGDKVFKVKA